jgi:hypothetical protein
VQTLQSLDNLLKAGKLTFRQYLERLPDGHIPKKAELLAEVEAAENAQKGGVPQDMPDGMAELLQQAGAVPQGAPAPQMPQAAPGPQPGGQDGGALMVHIREAAAAGKVHPEAAGEAEELAAQGAPAEVIVGALARATEQGRADRAFVDAMLAQMRPAAAAAPRK